MKLSTKIFIDGGVPGETRRANEEFVKHFGYPLDGQTTNPTLIAKNLQARLAKTGEKLTAQAALEEYKTIVREISNILPQGSVSIQVFANEQTSSQDMLGQARERITWIPNASIKFPCTTAGLEAVETACKEMPVNITLVFSQAQAAAVYEATKGAKYRVFLSPFVGRLDDRGENGMQVIENILKTYQNGDGHVEVLTASVRSMEHILYALQLGSQIITMPFKAFEPWAMAQFPTPQSGYSYKTSLAPIAYDDHIVLGKPWKSYDLRHDLTDKGLAAFWADWTSIISSEHS